MQTSVIEFDTAGDAIQHVNASGFGAAILLDRKSMVVSEDKALDVLASGWLIGGCAVLTAAHQDNDK